MEEVEVFRLIKFDKDKSYEFALETRSEGVWPNDKHYTTNKLVYLGRYTHSEDWGYGDNHGGAENFDDNGKKNRIVYDYEGKTCFREIKIDYIFFKNRMDTIREDLCKNVFHPKNEGKLWFFDEND